VPPQRISTINTKYVYSTKPAISTSVLILHTHPSGDPVPSPEDIELTRRLVAVGALMGIDVVEHAVLGDMRYWSFKEAGHL
jgi:DNA repair protein RadC